VNRNCLEGFKCPKCGYEHRFDIESTTTVTMTDDGEDGHGDIEWEDDSACTCCECGHTGTVKDFKEVQ
jgi:predicted nucleic-acid-binding Zn-ribbon protein